jgi:hypothetical protein
MKPYDRKLSEVIVRPPRAVVDYDKHDLMLIKRAYYDLIDFYKLPLQKKRLIRDIADQVRMGSDEVEIILQNEKLI